MKIKKLTGQILFLSMLIVAFTASVFAKGPVWKISKGDDHLFIGGTVHVLSYNDYPLPAVFEKTYSKSEQLVFETDITNMQSPAIQKKMMRQMTYQDGTTLKDHIKPETYQKLEKYLSKTGIPIETLTDFKPGMVAMMVTVMELQKIGVTSVGVDQFYNAKAVKDSKTIGQLETIDQQIELLASMGKEDPDEFIIYTLSEMKQLPTMFKDLKDAWKNGDNKKMAELAIEPLKEFPDTYQSLVVKRNKAWVPQIEAMLKTKEIEMVLVGALHLAGDESVLNLLKALGYKIEQL